LNNINNPFLTDIIWIKYNQTFFGYDSFLTIFLFCIYEYLLLYKPTNNIYVKFILEKSEKSINGEFEVNDEILKYLIKENIDILKTNTVNGKIIVVDDGYHKIWCVNQLFKIFDNDTLFCIKLIKKSECINRNYKNIISYEYLKPLISINDNYLYICNQNPGTG